MTRHEFLNRVRSLRFIDRDDLPELTIEEWRRFDDDPVRYFVRCDDSQADAIWREVERRQRATVAT